jgi:spore germination cell wall hydrolase CwlJ-like protein
MEITTIKTVLLSMMINYAPYNLNNINVDAEQALCLAQNVYHEAKGETLAGKSAVAHVTLNRVKHPKYPNNICDVVHQADYRTKWNGNKVPVIARCQFSWYCDGKADTIHIVYMTGDRKYKPIGPNMEAWKQSVQVALLSMKGITIDPTSGATHYYNHNISSPSWGSAYPVSAQIYNHTFLVRND